MKLWVVEVTMDVVVEAEDRDDAFQVAEDNATDFDVGDFAYERARILLDPRHIPEGYQLHSLPYRRDYSDGHEETIGQYFERLAEARKQAALLRPDPAAAVRDLFDDEAP